MIILAPADASNGRFPEVVCAYHLAGASQACEGVFLFEGVQSVGYSRLSPIPAIYEATGESCGLAGSFAFEGHVFDYRVSPSEPQVI